MSNIKNQAEMKMGLLESSLKHKNFQASETEDKANDMLKKQENVIIISFNFIWIFHLFLIIFFTSIIFYYLVK